MRHVDEGLLHAWIDGAFEAGTPEREEIEAHLAGCADCRVRLEDAHRVRDVAQDVLAAASPADTAAPPWDAIVAEHARRRAAGVAAAPAAARPARMARPRIPLAWAASLILAVGAGWMGRAMLAERASAPVQREMLESADALEDVDAAALRQEAAPPAVGGGAAVNESSAPAVLRREANAAAPPPAVTTEESRLRERASAVSPVEAQRFSDERAPVAKAAAPPAANLGRSLAADAADGIVAMMPAAPLARAADSVAGRWVAADSQAVSAALGTPALVVVGLTPDSLLLGTADGTPIARSVFVLADGVVEMLQRAATVEQDQSGGREAESVVTQSTLTLRGIEVLIRGSSAAAIEEVRGRLR